MLCIEFLQFYRFYDSESMKFCLKSKNIVTTRMQDSCSKLHTANHATCNTGSLQNQWLKCHRTQVNAVPLPPMSKAFPHLIYPKDTVSPTTMRLGFTTDRCGFRLFGHSWQAGQKASASPRAVVCPPLKYILYI